MAGAKGIYETGIGNGPKWEWGAEPITKACIVCKDLKFAIVTYWTIVTNKTANATVVP